MHNLFFQKSCWLFCDIGLVQNMLIFGRRCSTPLNVYDSYKLEVGCIYVSIVSEFIPKRLIKFWYVFGAYHLSCVIIMFSWNYVFLKLSCLWNQGVIIFWPYWPFDETEWQIRKRYVAGMLMQARSQAGCGPRRIIPKSKVYFYQQLEWAENGVFVEGLKGVRFKNSTFWVQKVNFV